MFRPCQGTLQRPSTANERKKKRVKKERKKERKEKKRKEKGKIQNKITIKLGYLYCYAGIVDD